MNLTVLSTLTQKLTGVLDLDQIGKDDVFLFTAIDEGDRFHMQGVKFPIKIAFLNKNWEILAIKDMLPEKGRAVAPKGTAVAIETHPDFFNELDLSVGDSIWSGVMSTVLGEDLD